MLFSSSSVIFSLLLILLVNYSEESVFSSLIRNNLNRYLKNPLFTKSFVRNSVWQGEVEDHGSLSPIISSKHSQLNELIKSQNHIVEPYGHYNFEMPALANNDYIAAPLRSTSPLENNNIKFPNDNNDNINFVLNSALFNNTQKDLKNTRTNSKSILFPNTNAYSDSRRINSFNKDHKQQKPNKSNLYVSDDSLNVGESISKAQYYNYHKKVYNNYSNNKKKKNSENNGQYNQEKALNLKLEYGFKPIKKDFISTNLIPLNEPDNAIETIIIEQDNHNQQQTNENDNLYHDLIQYNRTMKSMESVSNYSDELPTDYKKYISYPMEAESSDVHKLAFTGMESFRPDHNYIGFGYEKNYGLMDSITNYPNIKNFKKQGIECARQTGYCEYDSSYPIDYINSIINNCTSIIDDMYIEMPENMNDFSGYKPLFQVGIYNENNENNMTLCESERKYIRPSVIKDIHNDYFIILQSSFYFQQIPVEICLRPGSSCNFIGKCNTKVRCMQKYRTHTLISIEHTESDYFFDSYGNTNSICPKMRMYRLPSACVCELSDE